jgi:hypothetical protein
MKQSNSSIQIQSKIDTNRIMMLLISLFLDMIGMLSYLVPVVGEVVDVIWAPISALLIYLMYRKHNGAIGGVLGFMEEILPGADAVPTFTLMWIYKYYFSKKD